MSTLEAFVGHSFTAEDEEVVRKFLDYFTQIQSMGIGFSWEHAREAEPKVLADKVLKLIEDKNLFIGICTKKEKVIGNNKLKSKFLSKSQQCGYIEDFHWKTSDWIIQEIGLAIGRGMDLILLVEDGLRAPGGFQGNLEYIQFNRESPGDSFGRILEMVRALLPHAKPIEEAIAGKPKPAEEEEEKKEKGDEWANPKPEWKRQDYEIALMYMVDMKDKDGEKTIVDAYLATDDGKEQENIDSWVACREFTHILLSEDGSLGRLETLAKEKPDNSEVQRYLARAYQQFGEEEKAATAFIVAAENEVDNKKEILSLGDAAEALARANKSTELNEIVSTIKEKAGLIEDGEVLLLKCLIDISDIQNDKTLSLAYTERLLDLKPDDNNSRFNLAYGHSNEDREALALFHYLKIPYQSRSSMTWNNMGVSYSELGVEGKAIDAYRISEEKDETLAMDNIAKKLFYAGFFEEAEKQCDKAKGYEEYNKNVDDTMYRLKKKKEEENKKAEELLDGLKPIHEFYVQYGRAAVKENITELSGVWRTTQCELNIEITENKFKAHGTYEVPLRGLLRALGGQATDTETRKYEVIYEGAITGYSIDGTLRRSEVGKTPKASTLLTDDEDTKPVQMVVYDDLSMIKVYQESATNEYQKFHEISKDN
ncbi:MAG: hypothetical protein GY931_10525 [Maribacter sp.]|nr:hypothetical protein [Maribacter sp.]